MDLAVVDFNSPVPITVFINAAVDPERAWTASLTDIWSNVLGANPLLDDAV
jgi:hypothetical protein